MRARLLFHQVVTRFRPSLAVTFALTTTTAAMTQPRSRVLVGSGNYPLDRQAAEGSEALSVAESTFGKTTLLVTTAGFHLVMPLQKLVSAYVSRAEIGNDKTIMTARG